MQPVFPPAVRVPLPCAQEGHLRMWTPLAFPRAGGLLLPWSGLASPHHALPSSRSRQSPGHTLWDHTSAPPSSLQVIFLLTIYHGEEKVTISVCSEVCVGGGGGGELCTGLLGGGLRGAAHGSRPSSSEWQRCSGRLLSTAHGEGVTLRGSRRHLGKWEQADPQMGKRRASFTQQAALTQQGELPEEEVWPEQRVGWSPGSPEPCRWEPL